MLSNFAQLKKIKKLASSQNLTSLTQKNKNLPQQSSFQKVWKILLFKVKYKQLRQTSWSILCTENISGWISFISCLPKRQPMFYLDVTTSSGLLHFCTFWYSVRPRITQIRATRASQIHGFNTGPKDYELHRFMW